MEREIKVVAWGKKMTITSTNEQVSGYAMGTYHDQAIEVGRPTRGAAVTGWVDAADTRAAEKARRHLDGSGWCVAKWATYLAAKAGTRDGRHYVETVVEAKGVPTGARGVLARARGRTRPRRRNGRNASP